MGPGSQVTCHMEPSRQETWPELRQYQGKADKRQTQDDLIQSSDCQSEGQRMSSGGASVSDLGNGCP